MIFLLRFYITFFVIHEFWSRLINILVMPLLGSDELNFGSKNPLELFVWEVWEVGGGGGLGWWGDATVRNSRWNKYDNFNISLFRGNKYFHCLSDTVENLDTCPNPNYFPDLDPSPRYKRGFECGSNLLICSVERLSKSS